MDIIDRALQRQSVNIEISLTKEEFKKNRIRRDLAENSMQVFIMKTSALLYPYRANKKLSNEEFFRQLIKSVRKQLTSPWQILFWRFFFAMFCVGSFVVG